MRAKHKRSQSMEGLRMAEAILADAFDSALTEKFEDDTTRSRYLNAIMRAFEATRIASKARRPNQ